MDLTATHIAQLTKLSRQSVTRMAAWREQSPPLHGTIEVDVSCFGPRRIPGKRGRAALGKTIVFGLFEREGKVYMEMVPDAQKKTLQGIVRGKVASESVSVPMVGETTTGWWTWAMTNTAGYATAKTGSPMELGTSMALSLFGAMPNGGWPGSMGCRPARFICM